MSIDQSLSDAKVKAQLLLDGGPPRKVTNGSVQISQQYKADMASLLKITQKGEYSTNAKLIKANELRNKIAAITSNYFSG